MEVEGQCLQLQNAEKHTLATAEFQDFQGSMPPHPSQGGNEAQRASPFLCQVVKPSCPPFHNLNENHVCIAPVFKLHENSSRHLDSSTCTRKTKRTKFNLGFFCIFSKTIHPKKLHCIFLTRKVSTVILLKEGKPTPYHNTVKLLTFDNLFLPLRYSH